VSQPPQFRQLVDRTKSCRDWRGHRLAAGQQLAHGLKLAMAERHVDGARQGDRPGAHQAADQRCLQVLLARHLAGHHQLQRIVEIALLDAAGNHGLGHLDHVVRHAPLQGRVVGDEPEQPGIAKVLRTTCLAVGLGSDGSHVEQPWLVIEQAGQSSDVAALHRLHRRAQRRVVDAVAVEECHDRVPVGGLAAPGDRQRLAALAVDLPFQGVADDQPLDHRQRSAPGRRVQRRLAGRIVARIGAGAKQRIDDGEPRRRRRLAGTSLPQRLAAIAGRAVGAGALAQQAAHGGDIAGLRRRCER